MRTEKKFRLKTNLPGGHIAGEMVTDRSTGVWYWESTGMTCPYQPENEPQFFEIEHVAKFEVGDEVMLSYKASKISRLFTDKKSILKVIEVCKKSNIIHEQRYKVSLNRKHFTLAESELQSPVFYWFIGSNGKLNKDVIYEGVTENTFEWKYRKLTKNIFRAHSDAKIALERITKEIAISSNVK
jgi:hypothetical protein